MGNQQLCSLNNNQLQVILSGILGDGHIATSNSNSTYYITSCKFEEYIDFKADLLQDLFINKHLQKENGYSKTDIYILRTKSMIEYKMLEKLSIQEILDKLDTLGVAMWFYDDGSLHQKNMFYNLNTHSFTKEEQELYFIPFFNKMNIFPKITKEVKKDGRVFYYLRISKYEGAYEISKILSKYKIDCYKYKLWSSETILNWSKLQVQLKRQGITHTSNKLKGVLLNKLIANESIQDIVQSARKRGAAY